MKKEKTIKSNKRKWEEEFDKKFEIVKLGSGYSMKLPYQESIRQFIKSLLSQQRQEIINQIKEMRLKAPSPPNRHRRGFNQAIDQIIKSLKDK